jgi:probable F420-dependent oxidoreductase
MRIGLHVLGIGTGARPEIIESVARAAEAAGFATLWCGEHVLMVDRPSSRYPYAADGRIAVPADADWLDPLLGLSYAAAVTDSIGLATGVLLLPEHNPVMAAKQAATLDVLSAGRFTLGVGIGWSADEFAALGVPFERRAERTAEYIAAMRRLWADDVASFEGEFAAFGPIRVNPKPVRGRQIPVVIGGNSDAALRRVAAYGDGWYGFNIEIDDVRDRLAMLREQCRRNGRKLSELTVAVAVSGCGLGDIPGLADAGVTELVVLGSPPAEPVAAAVWVDEQARRWGLDPGRPRLTTLPRAVLALAPTFRQPPAHKQAPRAVLALAGTFRQPPAHKQAPRAVLALARTFRQPPARSTLRKPCLP